MFGDKREQATHITSSKHVKHDLSFDLFIFMTENACSQM